jgi:hypothetical protein
MPEDMSPPIPQYSPPTVAQTPRTMTAQESRQELQQAIQGSNQILASAHTVLALFPDTLIIDRAKVTVTKRQFFRMADVMSVRIEDVLNATCTVGPLFGTVSIVSRVMSANQSTTIGRFWRADAKRLKRILQGYIIALQRNIDCSSLGTRELAAMLEQLGADNHPDA